MPDHPSDASRLPFDELPVSVFRIDRQHRYLFVNRRFCDEVRRPPEELLGRSPAELGVPPDARAEFERMADEVFETGRPVERTMIARLPDGPRTLYAKLIPDSPTADGRPASLLAVGTDITQIAELDAARRDAEERFRLFMDHNPAVGWMKDADGRYVYQSAAYRRQVSNGADWIGQVDADVFPPDVAADLRRNDLAVLASDRPIQVREQAPHEDGSTHTWLSIKFPFRDAAGRRYVGGQAIDLTDRMRLEADRMRLAVKAEAAERERQTEARLLQAQKLESLGVLAGGIAHDFNNLLTAMLGYASLARMDLTAGETVGLDEYMGQIERGAQRAADLCKQMLAYAGRGQFAVRPVVLNLLVEEMAALLGSSISKKVLLRFNLAPDLPTVKCDPTQIRQVVMNLITNASDAIGDTSGVVTVTTGSIDADAAYLRDIGADYLPARRYVYLEVSDTGCGMDDATKARIFEPFFTTKFTGRGLGLSAVQGIVRGHGGALKVYSQLGKGTTFKVLLPAGDETAAPDPTTEPTTGAFGRGRRLLVIDDEEDVRVFARKVLERAGFAVELAADGRSGVDTFRLNPISFALVLCDLTMPKLDGHGVYREVRQTRKDVPTILMSGFTAEDATAGFEGKGLAGFLRKPFRAQDLLAAVRDAIGP